MLAFKRVFAKKFQSTHPLRGATKDPAKAWTVVDISIHAPLAGCDYRYAVASTASFGFQSTHPLRGATLPVVQKLRCRQISIHAPLAGCDDCPRAAKAGGGNFNPRTPCGVRPEKAATEKAAAEFQSTHPLRGATGTVLGDTQTDYISIHAPLAGCDPVGGIADASHGISIHAPLAGCDQIRTKHLHMGCNFNPRTPCGVRPRDLLQSPRQRWNFNPRTPCGVRRSSRFISARSPNFNPRTPCGVRPGRQQEQPTCSEFQSTHPLRGATREREQEAAVGGISIHAPLAGCDEEAS